MQIGFWGVRGSIPTPLTSEQLKAKFLRLIPKIPPEIQQNPTELEKFLATLPPFETGLLGGNTACVEVRADNKILIFDMGSGIKNLGNHLLKASPNRQKLELHIFLSHTHWDHILGFPFFTPAYYPNTTLNFYSCHPNLKQRLEEQQDFRFFPVSLDHMAARKNFIQLEHRANLKLGNIHISTMPLNHPGGSFGFRVEHEGKVMVYATDSEYKNLDQHSTKENIAFFKDADLLIFDAQYTFEEAIHKEDWGHSSALVGVELAVQAGVKRLVLFHHDPDRSDFEIEEILQKSIDFKNITYPNSNLTVSLATEDLRISL